MYIFSFQLMSHKISTTT